MRLNDNPAGGNRGAIEADHPGGPIASAHKAPDATNQSIPSTRPADATKIITSAERDTAPRGAKLLVLGPTGVGKTTLLRTVDPKTVLFVDIEAGDLAVQDLAIDTLRPRTWPECRDWAVALAGASPAVPDTACYSVGHYNAVHDQFGDPNRYSTFFIDSITAAGRLCFAWASQQPEAFSGRGQKDLRAAYGLHAREMLAWLLHLQQARSINIVLVGVLETITDDLNRIEHRLQLEGARTGRELPAIVDQVVTYHWIDFGDGTPVRSFVCTSPNKWGYPAKDRSGRLDQFEPPNLGQLLTKLTKPATASLEVAVTEAKEKESKS